MGWSYRCCVWLSDTYTMEDSYFSCYHDTVAVAMCDTSQVNSALGSYRYVLIIKVFNIICYVLLTRMSSHRLVLLWFSLCVFSYATFITWPIFRSVNLNLGAWSHNCTTRSSECPGGLRMLPLFFLCREHLRRAFSLRAATIILFANASLVAREATLFSRLAYVFCH